MASLLPLYQIFIYGPHALLQLRRFWNLLQTKLTNKKPYLASIVSMRLQLQELQETDSKAQELRQQSWKSYKEVDSMFHYQGLSFIPKIIRVKLISRHHDDLLAGYFSIEKTRKLLAQKYYWPTLKHDVKAYVKSCNICLALKAVRNKPYGDLQSLPIPLHWWKNLLIDFVTGLPILTNWKKDSYNSILVIVEWLTNMVYYKPVKITINVLGFAKVIINMVVQHHGLPNSIMTDGRFLFTLKFWSSLCYFLGIKPWLSNPFHP